MALEIVTVLFGRFWTFLYHDYCKFALIMDWFRIIRFLREVIRFANAFIVTVVGKIGECAQVCLWSKVLWGKSLCYRSIVSDQELASLFL